MNRNRTVAGLDVHKDSIYLCIMGYNESVIFQKTYGVLTPELRQMRDACFVAELRNVRWRAPPYIGFPCGTSFAVQWISNW